MAVNSLYACRWCTRSGNGIAPAMVYDQANVYWRHDAVFAGTVISAVAPEFGVLLVGRIVQAVGTGLLLPVLMNTIMAIFPPEKRGGAMGLIGLVIMGAPAIGPTLSGVIMDSLNWRWLFILVIPLAALSIIFSFMFLKNVSDITKPKVDLLSIFLSTIGFGDWYMALALQVIKAGPIRLSSGRSLSAALL